MKQQNNTKMQGDMIASSVIIEESDNNDKQSVPYPQNNLKFGTFIDQPSQNQKDRHYFPLFQDTLP